jgi:2-methylcitrate dehydratase PrpD
MSSATELRSTINEGSGAATAAAALARFCSQLRWAELPDDVHERTRELVLDLLGVALRGSCEASSQPPIELARDQPGPASVIGSAITSSAAWAALANGTSAHALELDDVTTESSLHPGVAVIPAALAVAEAQQASPSAFLEAVVAGYELAIRVGNALNPASAYARGFHPTGVAGVFGAAGASGRLLGLDATALTNAFGIAGTLAAGSLEYLADGAWTKRLNAGWAAHGGVVAANLARAGFTGPATVFEGRLGLLHAYSDAPLPERLLADLGDPFQVMSVSIKPYACCRYNHGLIDCMLQLRAEHAFDPSDVDAIRLGVLSGGALLVADPIEQKRTPTNIVDAQFSAPFAAAVALVRGGAGLDVFSLANVRDPLVRSLMARTDCYADPSLDADYPRRWPAAAEVRLRDGRSYSIRVEYATGEPEAPVSTAALVRKFTSLTGPVLGEARAAELAQLVLALDGDNPGDLSRLGEALRTVM